MCVRVYQRADQEHKRAYDRPALSSLLGVIREETPTALADHVSGSVVCFATSTCTRTLVSGLNAERQHIHESPRSPTAKPVFLTQCTGLVVKHLGPPLGAHEIVRTTQEASAGRWKHGAPISRFRGDTEAGGVGRARQRHSCLNGQGPLGGRSTTAPLGDASNSPRKRPRTPPPGTVS